MRICPFCSTENEVFFRFCLGCGADLDEATDGEAASVEVEAAPSAPAARPQNDTTTTRAVSAPAEPGSLDSTLVNSPPPGDLLAKQPAAKRSGAGQLVLILEDGSDGASYELSPESTTIGREGGDINFPHDDFLAPKHAEFFFSGSTLNLKPLKSTNGIFVQVSGEIELQSGDVFRIGQELLNFELLDEVAEEANTGEDGSVELGSPVPEGAWGRLAQLIAPETWGAVYLLGGSDIYLGRERGDITFPGDGFVSGLHAVVMQRDDRYFLKDLGSSNGTYFRLQEPTPLNPGSLVLAGQQLFRIDH